MCAPTATQMHVQKNAECSRATMSEGCEVCCQLLSSLPVPAAALSAVVLRSSMLPVVQSVKMSCQKVLMAGVVVQKLATLCAETPVGSPSTRVV